MGFFSFGKSDSSSTKMDWTKIDSTEQLAEAIASSTEKPALFFKHSTRCSISSMALNRFEQNYSAEDSRCNLYFIDLIAHRDISNAIADQLSVQHQSPQVILLNNHQVIHTASHSGIDVQEIERLI
jgi:bacillithiol system protein YtxJ